MTKTNILARGVALASILCGALALSACSTASGYSTTYNSTERLAPEEYSVSHTRNYMVDTITGFDRDGYKLPARELTREESIMVGTADQYCAARSREVEGLAMEYLSNGTVFSVLGAVGQAAGALGVPGADLASYAYLGAGSFAGSSGASTRMVVRQALVILHASCMQQQIQRSRDPRARDLAIYPVIAGEAKRPKTGTARSEFYDPQNPGMMDDPRREDELNSSQMTAPIVPM